jgi:transglutaminase-like putative cysteine protease
MLYRVTHTTRYEYDECVGQCHNVAYMMPRNTQRQTCLQADVVIAPQPVTAIERRDYFGNRAYHFAIESDHRWLEVSARSLVDMRESGNLGSQLDIGTTCSQALELLARAGDSDVVQAREFVLPSPLVAVSDAIRDYGARFFAGDRPLLSAVRELTRAIYQEFRYDTGFSDVSTPLEQVFEHRRGVCQDFAHVAIACARSAGFAARYVSGYLETVPPPGRAKLVGSDASHAWFAVYSPGEGWFEFDPTNDQLASHQHVVTAWGRDYADVAPLRGVIFGGGETHRLQVSVDVNRVGDRGHGGSAGGELAELSPPLFAR